MKLYEAVLIEPDTPTSPIRAVAPANRNHAKMLLGEIVILKIGTGLALPIRYNTPALILQTDEMNILLGYFDPGDKKKRKPQTIMDGDTYLTCGETRAVRFSDDGSVEIVNMFTNDNGDIISTPILSYNLDNELSIKFEKLVLDMFGGNTGGNIVWSQDKLTGFNTYIENYKTNSQDMGPRIYHTIEGSATGPTIKYIWDMSPVPIGGVLPALIDKALPASLQLTMEANTPIDLALNMLVKKIFGVTLDKLGALTIKHAIVGSEISMSATGEVTIKSTKGLGSITMDPTGAIKIKGTTSISVDCPGGVNIKGGGKSLMTILQSVLNIIASHIHPTSNGPTGTTTSMAQIAKAGIEIGVAIKGKA